MTRRLAGVAFCCLVLAWAGMAYACMPGDPPAFWTDKKIRIAADGSFNNAGDSYLGDATGLAVVDIGEGKIGQRLKVIHFCGYSEQLLVVDCNTTEMIVIDGRVDPNNPDDFGGGPSTTVNMLYPPDGKIRLTPATTIGSLVQISTNEGYQFETDPQAAFGGGKRKNRYDPFNGCGIFYPHRVGASQ